jgi:hypothetical protein
MQDSVTGAITLTETDPGAQGAPVPPSGAAGGTDLSDLPPLPQAKSGKFPLGTEVGFQLVNCTPAALDVRTFNQHDLLRAIPFKTYSLEPEAAVDCFAKAHGDPFDIQYTVNGQLARARQSTRVYVIQVGSCNPDRSTMFGIWATLDHSVSAR